MTTYDAEFRTLTAEETEVAGGGFLSALIAVGEAIIAKGIEQAVENPDQILTPLPTPEQYKKMLKGRPA